MTHCFTYTPQEEDERDHELYVTGVSRSAYSSTGKLLHYSDKSGLRISTEEKIMSNSNLWIYMQITSE